jgi:hypothetical protein
VGGWTQYSGANRCSSARPNYFTVEHVAVPVTIFPALSDLSGGSGGEKRGGVGLRCLA